MAREYMYTPPRNSDSIWGDVTQAQRMHHYRPDGSELGLKAYLPGSAMAGDLKQEESHPEPRLTINDHWKKVMAGDYHELSIGNLW